MKKLFTIGFAVIAIDLLWFYIMLIHLRPLLSCFYLEPDDKAGLGNLARYIIRACFSQERMVYIPIEKCDDGVAKVIYTSKDRKSRKVFTALDWLARLVTHIPIPQKLSGAFCLTSCKILRY